MLWNFDLSEWFPAHQGRFSRAILLCVNLAILFTSVDGSGTSEPQNQQSLQVIDLNAESMKQHRWLAPISGYVQFGFNLAGDTDLALFGSYVAIDEAGTTIAVHERGTDTVRVYEIAANIPVWTPKGQDLTGFPHLPFRSGFTVAISRDGSIVAVSSSANEVVVVFQYNSSSEMWLQRDSTIVGVELDGSPIFSFGWAISLSADGDKVVVGAPLYDTPTNLQLGFATTYFWDGTDWQREQYDDPNDLSAFVSGLYGPNALAQMGWSVAYSGDGNWFAVGMPGSGPSDSDSTRFGECRVYASDGILNQNFVDGGAMFGSTISDNFGYSVALNYDGSIVAVSSPRFDLLAATQIGKVQVFQRADELWVQLGR
eukprot:Sro33_g021221.2  (370) ;mRNA; r:16648-17757